MSMWIIEFVVRLLVFGLVFGIVSHRSAKVSITPRLALPVVAVIFALLNVGLYWVAKPILNMATLGFLAFALPLVLNGVFLYLTTKVTQRMRIDVKLAGLMTMLWLAALLTAAHGALYVVFDVLVK